MKIVKATKKDAEEVFGVIKEAVLTVYPGYYPPAVTSWFANELHGFARTAEQFYLRQGYAPEGEGEAVVYGERLVWKKMAKRLRED